MASFESPEERGSRIAKGGFYVERFVENKFKDWRNQSLAQDWLKKMGYSTENIRKVDAKRVSGGKADVTVYIEISDKVNVERISAKKIDEDANYNQLDKRWVDHYQKLWNMPPNVVEGLKMFTGEAGFRPSELIKRGKDINTGRLRNGRRLYLTEMEPEISKAIISFFKANKDKIVEDLIKGRGDQSADWLMVAMLKNDGSMAWTIKRIDEAIRIFSEGDIEISNKGNLHIGRIIVQRKGGNAGRDTAQMLQFKINPKDLFD